MALIGRHGGGSSLIAETIEIRQEKKEAMMKIIWKKTLLVALPLAGFLLSAPTAEAHKPHKHKRDRYCRTYDQRDWHDRGRYDYYGRRGWYEDRRPYYNDQYYPSRYPYRPYYDRSYDDGSYYRGFPWWWVFDR
jgi:hypothetical protein